MRADAYRKEQSLNEYAEMLNNIYGPSQNYAKSKFEILSHLAEVVGVAGKHLFKRNDAATALKFMPKIFGWTCALLRSVQPQGADLERIILQKFPGICPYCLHNTCACWDTPKPTMDSQRVSQTYYNRASQLARGPNDFEVMFSQIYQHSWESGDPRGRYTKIYLRLVEEISEVAEAVRFHHLYPENLENEIADLFAWWFALVSFLRREEANGSATVADMLWRAYPGHCSDCQSTPCFCLQGPVRELVSKPAPGHLHEIDVLTSLRNQGAYKTDIDEIRSGQLVFAAPIACVRADVDSFKLVNDTYGHQAGDLALKHIAQIMRKKSGPRTRLYRISGDEFGVLIPDSSKEEAHGMMRRVVQELRNTPVVWTNASGTPVEFKVAISAGISECLDPAKIEAAFERADQASYRSKEAGGGRVSMEDMRAETAADHVADLQVS
jgi:diguanylate cyclase (GGDEF)-like protein